MQIDVLHHLHTAAAPEAKISLSF